MEDPLNNGPSGPTRKSGDFLLPPLMGMGTFQPEAASEATIKEAVLQGLDIGYRHVDTAWMYGNGATERAVGQALQEWSGERKDVYLVSKLANLHHRPDDVAAALELTLENLGVEHLDLYLMHYPIAYRKTGDRPRNWATARHADGKPDIDLELSRDYAATWKAMESLVFTGKVKAIGVSNFSARKLEKLLETATIKPLVNQVEMHPYLPQQHLIDFCARSGVHLTAHSPLGGRPVPQVALNCQVDPPLKDQKIHEIAVKNRRSVAQVLLKWALQRRTSVIPKAYNIEHLRANYTVLEQSDLTNEDMEAISALREADPVRFMDPSNHWGFDIFDEAEDQP